MFRIYRAFNEWLALKVTLLVGTMECVYAFAALVTLPLIAPQTQTVVQYVSSSYLQLILLPMLMVGQALLNRASETRAKQDHDILLEELRLLREIVGRVSHPAACEAAPAA